MIWASPSEFFAMGGYALYVWSSFGLCAAALAGEQWRLRQRRRQIVRSLQRQALAEQLDKEEA